MIDNFKFKTEGINLEINDIQKVNSFIDFINKNNEAKLLFRGDNYENLKTKLNLTDSNDYTKLSYYIFLIGDKGRKYRNEFKREIKKKSKIFPINSTDEKIFKYIFNKMNSILLKSDKSEIIEFKSNNPDITNYFTNKKNKKSDFLEKTQAISIQKDKIRIRDYYLNLLHQIGRIGFFTNSFFVSATTNFETAKYFSNNSDKSERIIFISWLSYPFNKLGVNFNYLNSFKTKLKKVGLPIYANSFFPKQEEISIKGALLPHYIIGYLRLEKKIFEINPHFLRTTQTFKNIIQNGIDIDQKNFHPALKETDYGGFMILDNLNEFSDFDYQI